MYKRQRLRNATEIVGGPRDLSQARPTIALTVVNQNNITDTMDDYLESDHGQQVIINKMQENRESLRDVVA